MWTRSLGALVRLAIDQVFFAPSIIAVFLTGMGVLEGRSAEEIKQKFSTVRSFEEVVTACYL